MSSSTNENSNLAEPKNEEAPESPTRNGDPPAKARKLDVKTDTENGELLSHSRDEDCSAQTENQDHETYTEDQKQIIHTKTGDSSHVSEADTTSSTAHSELAVDDGNKTDEYFQVLEIYLTDDTDQMNWLTSNLTNGSKVKVGQGNVDVNWIWKRSFDSDSAIPRWSFHSQSNPSLYLTHHSDSGNLTMEPASDNMYFVIEVGANNGYCINVPGMDKFIGTANRELVLADNPTQWNVTLEPNRVQPLVSVYNELMMIDQNSGDVWICDIPSPGAKVIVAPSGRPGLRNTWISEVDASSYSRDFRPSANTEIFVTCGSASNTISLEEATLENKKSRRIKYRGNARVVLCDFGESRYLTALPITPGSDVKVLTLSEREKDGIKWRPYFCRFQHI